MRVQDRDRVGQVIVPIPLAAVYRMGVEELANTYTALALATAKENGGTLAGRPEILRREEILPRMVDADPELRAVVDDVTAPSVFLLATMIPYDWSSFDRGDVDTAEYVARPRLVKDRRGR